jgi:hypothetical protein
MYLQISAVSGYDSCYIVFLDQQVHICLKITLHPTSPQQKCLPLCVAGGHMYTKCMKVTMEFVEWVVIVSVRWAFRTEDRISTLSVVLYVFTLSNLHTCGDNIYKFLPLSCLALMMLF